MSNIKISQLPSQTAATDNDLLVIVDSGETLTSKITRAELLNGVIPTCVYQSGTGTDSITPSYLAAGSVSSGTANAITNGTSNSVSSTQDDNTIVGGELNSISNSLRGGILGGYSNTISSSSTDGANTIVGGYASTISNGGVGSIIGANATISSGGLYNVVAATFASNIASGSRNFVAGGVYLDMNSGDNNVLLGGNNNDINAGTGMGIIAGQSNVIQDYGQTGVIIGCENSSLKGYKTWISGGEANHIYNDSRFTGIYGGYGNQVNGTNSQGIAIINSWQSKTYGSGAERHLIINSDQSTITGSSYTNKHATIIASNNSHIAPNYEKAVLIGLDGKSALYSATTQMDNTHTHRVHSFDVIDVGSVGGNIDVDCSLASLFLFTLTANTIPNFINFRDGQKITFVITNTTYGVPSATISGGGSVYSKQATISPSNNNKTLYYATFIAGDVYIDEHTGFDAV